MRLTGCVSALLALAAPAAVAAQEWDMGPMSMHVASQSIEFDSKRSLRLAGQPPRGSVPAARLFAAQPAARPVAISSRYQRQPAVSAKVRKALVDRMARTSRADAAKLDKMIANGSLFRSYDQVLRPYGLHANDAVDALASYWVIQWLLANDVAQNPAPADVRAVRRQIAARIDPTSAAQLRDAATRQEFGETLVYRFMLLEALRGNVLKSGDGALRRQISEQAHRDGLQNLGVDLRTLRLTAAGFQPRA